MILAWALAASAQAPPSRPEASAGARFHDPVLYAQASEALRAGQADKALSLYCAMLRPPSRGELWTVSVVLLCDAQDLWPTVSQIQSPSPTFVQARDYQGRRCYRVCAGLTASRAEASRWVALLPAALKPQGPFPVPVIFPCAGSAPPAPASAPPPAPAPQPPVERGGAREFLGPPVKVPPEPAPKPAEGKAPDPAALAPTGPPPAPSKADDEAQAWFQRGVEAYGQGRKLDAYEYYGRALELEPDRPEILNNLGVLYLEEKHFAQAEPLFRKAIARSPAYAAAHLNLAGALWGLKRFDDAIQEAREAAILDPQNVNADLTLASFLLATGRKEEAAKAAKQALLLDPKNERAQVFLEAAQAPPDESVKKR